MKKLLLILLILPLGLSMLAQTGVAINSDGSDPDASAILDVSSTDKGMTVPRMTTAQRTAISNPATGLVVYDTDNIAFYYYDTGWNKIANQHKLGGGNNYAEFEDDGTLVFYGSSTTWEDLQIPGFAFQTANNSPILTAFSGTTMAYVFANESNTTKQNQIFFTAQIPHSWKVGSTIYPHVHCTASDNTAGDVVWGLEYAWAKIGSTYPGTSSTIYATGAMSGTSLTHQVIEFPGITPSTSQDDISSILVCRLFRNSSNTTTDTYGSGVYFLQFDIHYESNTEGSRTEWVK